MKIIKRIDESDKYKTYVKETKRRSVRSVIVRDGKMLALYLSNLGEYKMPGGGVEHRETLIDALKRETLEETGFTIKEIIRPLGKIIHTREDKIKPEELFTQTSYYYVCEVYDTQTELKPSPNEVRYGIIPKWEELDKIIDTNKKNIYRLVANFSVRELYMFEYIKALLDENKLLEE